VFWLNRLGAPAEELGVTPHGTGRSMSDLMSFIEHQASSWKPAKPEKSSRTRHSPGA
jgi:2-haloacid dehalogenase